MALINYFRQRGYPGTKVVLTDEDGGTPSGTVIPAFQIVDASGNSAGGGTSSNPTITQAQGSQIYKAVTPSDSVALSPIPKALYIGGAGNLTVKGSDGVSAVFAVIAGQKIDIGPTFVMATGTTATGIVALD